MNDPSIYPLRSPWAKVKISPSLMKSSAVWTQIRAVVWGWCGGQGCAYISPNLGAWEYISPNLSAWEYILPNPSASAYIALSEFLRDWVCAMGILKHLWHLSYMSDMCKQCGLGAKMLSYMSFLLHGACKIAMRISLHPDVEALSYMPYIFNALQWGCGGVVPHTFLTFPPWGVGVDKSQATHDLDCSPACPMHTVAGNF